MEDLREPTGTGALAIFLRKIVRAIRSNRILDGVNYKVTRTQNGQLLSIQPSSLPGTPGTIDAYKVVSHELDHLVCHTWNGTTEGEEEILIAKPDFLRFSEAEWTWQDFTAEYTEYDTTNQTRLATSTNGTDVEMIVRPYQAGDVVFAAETVTNVLAGGGPLTLLDLNVSARHWAKKYVAP